jgi:hypothetical protein
MRFKLFVLLAACAAMLAVPAFAGMQNVETFGSLQIRGNWYSPAAPGLGQGDFTESGDTTSFYEQRTTLGFKVDFTDDVTAVIHLDNYGNWGDSFRSEPITGGDTKAGMVGPYEDVALYQGYIEMRDIGGYAINAKIGRQEVMLGSEWLIGNNSTASHFRHLSFDGISATYAADSWSLTGGAFKLHDNSGMGSLASIGGIYGGYSGLGQVSGSLEDGDTDLYVVYGSYTGIEDLTIDAYWIYLRDARDFGISGADNTELHTFGARVAGATSGFDYEGEVAFQTGDTPIGGDWEGVGVNAEGGYTFDHELNPRVFLGAAFFSGEDDGEDLGFNRLFSDWEYSEFLDDTTLSNVLIVRGGGSIEPTEKIGVSGTVGWFQADEDLGEDDIGVEIGLYGTYQYSEDLAFEAGYAHFFVGDGGEEGNVINGNQLFFIGNNNLDDEDADYFYLQSSISF